MAHFAQGKFTLKNPKKYMGNKTPTYRSGWEFTFMKFCDEHPSVSQWASESIRIPYRNPLTGKQTIYVPDFFIVYADKNGKQRVELVEVKPRSHALKEKLGKSKHNQAHYIINQAKWEAAVRYCKDRNWKFQVLTEEQLFGKKAK